jgi:hypothetical protein
MVRKIQFYYIASSFHMAPPRCRFFLRLLLQQRVATSNACFGSGCKTNISVTCVYKIWKHWSTYSWSAFGAVRFGAGWLVSSTAKGALIAFVAWKIWRVCNRRIFTAKEVDASALIRIIRDEASCWVLAGARHLMPQE